MGYIYIIKNDINNKVYIGQTKKTIDYRFKEHIRQANYENKGIRPLTYFHSAINKYGSNHFYYEILEKCDDELLNEREIYWIDFYDSYKNGYNSTLGGQEQIKIKNSKKVIQYDLNGNLKNIFEDSSHAAKETNIEASYIRLVCNPNTLNKTAGGYQWKYYEDNFKEKINPITGKQGRVSQKINQYDLEGNYIKTFNSANEAAKMTNQSRRNISLACEGKQNKAGGFQWRYENDYDTPKNLIVEQLKKYCNPIIPILQKDKKGNLIKQWNSILEASKELKLDAKKIGLTCENKQKTYNNFQWQYKI